MNKQKNWQEHPVWNGSWNWTNFFFLVATPILTAILIPLYLRLTPFSFWNVSIFFVMMLASGFAITAGYHRLFSHQTYECHPAMRFFYLLFGAAALQNSCLKWSSDHRYHHRFVDKDSDPYSISKGFFYAHMGWIFLSDPEGRSYSNVQDLERDPLVRWQHENFLWIAVVVGFGLPTLMGALVGHPLGGLLFGGLLRTVFVHHGTFLINSAAHTFGKQTYSEKVSARDCWWLAFFTNGEGYHNFHHVFANDYRNGLRWYQWDPTKWLILGLQFVGLSKNLKRTQELLILKAKLENSYEDFRKKWSRPDMPAHLERVHQALLAKAHELQIKAREFQSWNEQRKLESRRNLDEKARYWKARLQAEKKAFEYALAEYNCLLQATLLGQMASLPV